MDEAEAGNSAEHQSRDRFLSECSGRLLIALTGGRRKIAREFGKPEVEHLDKSALGDYQVRALDIAVNNAERVGFIERIGNLHCYVDRVVD